MRSDHLPVRRRASPAKRLVAFSVPIIMRFRLPYLFALIVVCAVVFLGVNAAVRMDREWMYLHAAQNGELETIRWCLNHGVDVNTRDGWSSTALMYASAGGYTDIVHELLNAGADPNERTRLKRTALMWAAKYGHSSTITLLLERGAEAGLLDADGMTAHDHATTNGFTAAATLLSRPEQKGSRIGWPSGKTIAPPTPPSRWARTRWAWPD